MTEEIEKLCSEIEARQAGAYNPSCPPDAKCGDYCPSCWADYIKEILTKFRDKRIAELEAENERLKKELKLNQPGGWMLKGGEAPEKLPDLNCAICEKRIEGEKPLLANYRAYHEKCYRKENSK